MYRALNIFESFLQFIEQIRMVFVMSIGCLGVIYNAEKYFFGALAIAFVFDIWAGMRADNVSISREGFKNFEIRKFSDSLKDLFWLVVLIMGLKASILLMKDAEVSVFISKSLVYVAIWRYWTNCFKNLIKVNPTNITYRIIYHFSRFEFYKLMPANINKAIELAQKEIQEYQQTQNKNNEKNQ